MLGLAIYTRTKLYTKANAKLHSHPHTHTHKQNAIEWRAREMGLSNFIFIFIWNDLATVDEMWCSISKPFDLFCSQEYSTWKTRFETSFPNETRGTNFIRHKMLARWRSCVNDADIEMWSVFVAFSLLVSPFVCVFLFLVIFSFSFSFSFISFSSIVFPAFQVCFVVRYYFRWQLVANILEQLQYAIRLRHISLVCVLLYVIHF